MVDEALTADDTAAIDVSNVSESQVDKFFESGGKEVPAGKVEESAPAGETQEKQAEQTQAKEEQQKEKYVPYEALHEERMRRKELAAEVKQANDRAAKIEQTFQKMVQQANEPKQPSFEEDPIEALRVGQEKLARDSAARDRYINEQVAIDNHQKNVQAFISQYQNSAREFAKTQTDFGTAYDFLRQSRVEEYKHAGYNDKEATQLFNEDEAAVVSKAFNEGINPAERIYKLAQHRGYAKAQQAQDDIKKGEDKMTQLEKGMQSSKSLSNVSGKSPISSNEITLEALSHMDTDELAEYVSGKNWEKIAKQFR